MDTQSIRIKLENVIIEAEKLKASCLAEGEKVKQQYDDCLAGCEEVSLECKNNCFDNNNYKMHCDKCAEAYHITVDAAKAEYETELAQLS